jgi:DNA-binding CsgD family transcriptional regulator
MGEVKVIVVERDNCFVLSATDAKMLQMAAEDYSRKHIAEYFGLSVRTVEAKFDTVRKQLGKKSFAAALVELMRQKVIK